jgi:predicted GH43/DUF377 family glycosyl hydrolase
METPTRLRLGRSFRWRQFRANAARPLLDASEIERYAAPELSRLAGGVFNPGALDLGGEVVLLARGEQKPVDPDRLVPANLLHDTHPVLIRLMESMAIRETVVGPSGARGKPEQCRLEDFRLVSYRDQVLTNHAVVLTGGLDARAGAVDWTTVRTVQGLSRVDLQTGALDHLGEVAVDFRTQPREKNWVYFTRGDELFAMYSFRPFRMLRLVDFDSLRFATFRVSSLSVPGWLRTVPVRNSVNPVTYDDDHLIGAVHAKLSTTGFVFWPILIDRRTLLPTWVLKRPLVAVRPDADASNIVYVSSIVARSGEIVLFVGIGDRAVGCARVLRSDLDRSWSSLG